MKKALLALIISAAPAVATADTILGLYVGAGQWQTNFSGDIGENGRTASLSDLGFDKESTNIIWGKFEHPVPLIPNIKLVHSRIVADAYSTTSEEFSLGGTTIEAEVDVLTEVDLTHTDATLYYELLDNWVALDAGVTVRQFAGYVQVQTPNDETFSPTRSDLEGIIPLAYLSAEFHLPFSGWLVGVNGNAIKYRGDGITDVSAHVGYYFDAAPMLDVGFSVGYRNMSLKLEEMDDLYADGTLSGPYAELLIHF